MRMSTDGLERKGGLPSTCSTTLYVKRISLHFVILGQGALVMLGVCFRQVNQED